MAALCKCNMHSCTVAESNRRNIQTWSNVFVAVQFVFTASLGSLPFIHAKWDVTTKWAVAMRATKVNAEKCILRSRSWVKGCAQNVARIPGNEPDGWRAINNNFQQFYFVFMNLQASLYWSVGEAFSWDCFKSTRSSCSKHHRKVERKPGDDWVRSGK